MDDHDTHFDDCGCLSQKYKEVIKDLLEVLEYWLPDETMALHKEKWNETVALIQKAQKLSK